MKSAKKRKSRLTEKARAATPNPSRRAEPIVKTAPAKKEHDGSLLFFKAARAVASIFGQRDGEAFFSRVTESGLTADQLDQIYRSSSLIRMVFDTKMKTIINLDWDIIPKPGVKDDKSETIARVRRLFEYPNPDDSYYAFMMKILYDLFIYDSLAIEKVKAGETIVELIPVDGSTISPCYSPAGYLTEYKQFPRGKPNAAAIPFKLDELILAHEYPANHRRKGLTALESLIVEIGSDLYAMNFNASWFSEGYLFSKVLTAPGIGEANVEKLEAHFQQRRGHANTVPVLDLPAGGGEAKLLDFGFSARDMEFSKMEEWVFKRICGVAQVSANEVMELYQSATRASAEVQKSISDSKGFKPILLLLQEEFNRQVVEKMDPQLTFKFVPERMTEEQKADLAGKKRSSGVPLNKILVENGRDAIDFTITVGDQSFNPYDYPDGLVELIVQAKSASAPTTSPDGGAGVFFSRPGGGEDGSPASKATKPPSKNKIVRAMKPIDRDAVNKKLHDALVDVFDDLRKAIKKLIRDRVPPSMKSESGDDVLKAEAGAEYKAWSSEIVLDALNQSKFPEKLESKMKKTIAELFAENSARVLSTIDVSFSADFWNEAASAYYKKRFYDKGVLYRLTQTQKDQLGALIASKYEAGRPLKEWWLELEDAVDKMEDWQAERIARTESLIAATEGTMDTWKGMGVRKWEFIASPGACGLCKAIGEGGTPLSHDPQFRGEAAGVRFKGSPYTEDEMNNLSSLTGFDAGLPHPNCEDAWAPYIDDDGDLEEVVRRAREIQQRYS